MSLGTYPDDSLAQARRRAVFNGCNRPKVAAQKYLGKPERFRDTSEGEQKIKRDRSPPLLVWPEPTEVLSVWLSWQPSLSVRRPSC